MEKNFNASRRWDGEVNFRSFELLHIESGDGFELGYGKELFYPSWCPQPVAMDCFVLTCRALLIKRDYMAVSHIVIVTD